MSESPKYDRRVSTLESAKEILGDLLSLLKEVEINFDGTFQVAGERHPITNAQEYALARVQHIGTTLMLAQERATMNKQSQHLNPLIEGLQNVLRRHETNIKYFPKSTLEENDLTQLREYFPEICDVEETMSDAESLYQEWLNTEK